MATIHLAECDPGLHPDWVKTTAYEAFVAHNAALCEQTAYMAGELYPDETVWVEVDDAAELGIERFDRHVPGAPPVPRLSSGVDLEDVA